MIIIIDLSEEMCIHNYDIIYIKKRTTTKRP